MLRISLVTTLTLSIIAAAQVAAQPADVNDTRGTPPANWQPAPIRPEPILAEFTRTEEIDGTIAEIGEAGGLPADRWLNDKRVSNPDWQSIEPAMTAAPNGRLFIATEDHGTHDGWVSIFESTDNGENWTWRVSFRTGTDARNPDITYAQRTMPDEQYLFLTYEANFSDNSKDVMVIRVDPRNIDWDPVNVVGDIFGTPDIHPSICTDYLLYNTYYVYVSYSVSAIDYYAVMFSRSLNSGETYSAPIDITGGSESSVWPARPDIAYGTGGLFVAFEKPGWTGSEWDKQVWVTQSDNFGVGWSSPMQLSFSNFGAWHPSVAIANGTPTTVVAYSYGYEDEADIHFSVSTDGGDTFVRNFTMPWTYDDEKSVALCASESAGRFHAFWWRDYDIVYSTATVASPEDWSTTIIVNQSNLASSLYSKPAACVLPPETSSREACVAWTDMRDASYAVYFDGRFRHAGDMNCDGVVSVSDIGGFVLAVSNPAAYAAAYPDCDVNNADVNGDGHVTVADIGPFVQLLAGS